MNWKPEPMTAPPEFRLDLREANDHIRELTAERDRYYDALMEQRAQNREVRAERDRLRAALENILDAPDGDEWLSSNWQDAQGYARAALDSGPQD